MAVGARRCVQPPGAFGSFMPMCVVCVSFACYHAWERKSWPLAPKCHGWLSPFWRSFIFFLLFSLSLSISVFFRCPACARPKVARRRKSRGRRKATRGADKGRQA